MATVVALPRLRQDMDCDRLMATFNLPSTKRLPGLGDPNILPKRPGMDYAARADEAWREIGENKAAMEMESDRWLRTAHRSDNGAYWVFMNAGHPDYDEAYQTLRQLQNEMTNLDINIRCLERVVWNNVLVLYACLSHIDRQAWLDEHGVGFDGTSPESIWQAVCPGREQPGSYPPDKREAWLERKINYASWQAKEG